MIHSIHSASFKRILVSGAFPSATDFFSFPDFRLFLFVYGSYVIHKHHPPQHPRVLLWLDKVLGRVHKHHPSQDHCDVLFLEKLGKCVCVCVFVCVCVGQGHATLVALTTDIQSLFGVIDDDIFYLFFQNQ
jgi:hypothetical protein